MHTSSRWIPCALSLAFLSACVPPLPEYDRWDNPSEDFDLDGQSEDDGDCDDQNAATFKGADEICDDLDNNCDGLIDNDAVDEGEWYLDEDGDGYGKDSTMVLQCESPTQDYVNQGGDCDDTIAAVNPGAQETCSTEANGIPIDDDCNGLADELDPGMEGVATWYRDADNDGFGDDNFPPAEQCERPAGYVRDAGDCDDGRASVSPNHPEICDGLDNNCDDLVDDDDPTVSGLATWYADADGDGFGTTTDTTESCEASEGYVEANTDCDDGDAEIHPGATEACDSIDNDCDGAFDEGVTTTFYQDADGDGFGNRQADLEACTAPSGYTADFSDCNDTNANANPGAVEVCDNVDNDCDSRVDLGAVDAATWYLDADGDGFGTDSVTMDRCSAPSGFVDVAGDCNDGKIGVHPNATETCATAFDDNCDGDNNDEDALGCRTFYTDADGDGAGAGAGICQCVSGGTSVLNDTDCDDTNPLVHPYVQENCNTPDDDDCDGSDNNPGGVSCLSRYYDGDGDGYGLSSDSLCLCEDWGYYEAAADGDCDDADPLVSPGAAEVCFDGADNNCDGYTDDATATDATTWYRDVDQDGYGDASDSLTDCNAPTGYVADATDCDDVRAAANPGATETCTTGFDDDCDGDTNDQDAVGCTVYYEDADADTFGVSSSVCHCEAVGVFTADNTTDCDDTDAFVNSEQTESCVTAYDDDCDGDTNDEGAADCTYFYEDWDLDTYGVASSGVCHCVATGVYTAVETGDCDDTTALTNPGYNNCGLYGNVPENAATGTISSGLTLTTADLNGNGSLDWIFNNKGYDGSRGRTYIVYGPVTGNIDPVVNADATLTGSGFNLESGEFVAGFEDWGGTTGMVVVAEEDAYHVVDAGNLFGDQELVSTASATITWVGSVWVYDAAINLGDVNNDGYDDLGLTDQSNGVYLFHGPVTSNQDYTDADSIISANPNSSDQLRACGDINNDGMDDLVVSYFGNSLFYVSPFGATVAGGDYIAYLNTGASHSYGKYTDDTLVDVAAGDWRDSGTYYEGGVVRIWAGPLSGTLDNSNATYEIEGSYTSQKFGNYTNNAGDINGDGYDDLLASPRFTDSLGYLFYGPITANTDTSQVSGTFDDCRYSKALGDTNGDGMDDFACKSPPSFWFLGEAL
jgi:hypothetical protein